MSFCMNYRGIWNFEYDLLYCILGFERDLLLLVRKGFVGVEFGEWEVGFNEYGGIRVLGLIKLIVVGMEGFFCISEVVCDDK